MLKGPQALLFGKNNTAGVISLVSADPTKEFSGYGRIGYEFVADEVIGEGAVGGPISDTLGFRVAVRGRKMKGWMYNDAHAFASPYLAGYTFQEPDHRLGDDELTGRLTLKYDPTTDFSATLKVLGSHMTDDGFGVSQQAIGPCPSGAPFDRGVRDPFGECNRDNHTTAGLPDARIVANGSDPEGPHGKLDALMVALNMSYDLGSASVTSTTGYIKWNSEAAGAGSATSGAQLFGSEPQKLASSSQELRLLTNFESPINFMVGAFYQDLDFDYEQNVKLIDAINYNPANGKFIAWQRPGHTYGKTYSAFGQLIFRPSDQFEIAGGARYTRELKDSYMINAYTFQPGFPQGKAVGDNFRDSNVSPEVTFAYHPSPRSTLYAAYRSGFKSGGFALSGTIQTASKSSDYVYGSEKAHGVEAGAKGELLDNRLRLQASVYYYDYDDLQVTTYNPTTISYTFSNAAALKQKGFDAQALFQATSAIQLHGAINYNRNRFGKYNAPCYGGQTAAQGCNILPGPAQSLQNRPPARSPDWAGNAGVSLDVPFSNDVEINLAGDAFYSSVYYGSETLAPSTRQDAFWRFNASARVMQVDGRWELGLIGRNLSNYYYLQQAQDKSGGIVGEQKGTVARGREVLVQLGFKF